MIQQLSVRGSHYDVGYTIGQHFGEQIHHAFDNYTLLKDLHRYHQTDVGQTRYTQMLALHQTHYPQYIQELEGMADGANLNFTDLFMVNLRGEYRGFLSEADDIRGCSDCSILTDDLALIGHNEDGSPAFRDHIYFVHATITNGIAFTACSYPGFICGNAFGFNSHGLCISIDNIRPTNIRVGISRQFLARSLLDATSIDDAIRRVTPEGRASGFSYTIGSIEERRIVQVEVTPDQFNVYDVQQANFHANHIQMIVDAPQQIDISSAERVARAESILSNTSIQHSEDILGILGDQGNTEYPIYRTATAPDVTETFCTALFNLDARELSVYPEHPVKQSKQVMHFKIE